DSTKEDSKTDSTFSVENVESEAALEDFISGSSAENEGEQIEQAIQLATYAADCESCATKVYFELEDLDEDDNLLCPNCNEKIEINRDAIEYYRVDKTEMVSRSESEGNYVVDCDACEAVVHFTADDIDDEENIVCPQCGEKIHIDTEVLDAYLEKDLKASIKKKRILKKVAVSVAGVLLALAVSCCVIYFTGMKSVVKVDGTSVPMNIYQIYYYQHAKSHATEGYLDLNKKASKQLITATQGYDDWEDSEKEKYSGFETWNDVIKAETADDLKIMYSFYNKAREEGFELPESYKKDIDDNISNVKELASSYNQSFEEYMKSQIGTKVTEEDFRAYLELSAYDYAYIKSVLEKDVTQEQLDKLYKDNSDNYNLITFRYFYVQVSESVTKKDALNIVEKISKAKNEDEFYQLVKENVSEEQAASLEKKDSTLISDMAWNGIEQQLPDGKVKKLLSGEKAKKGDVSFELSEDGTYAHVAMIVEPLHKSEDRIRDDAINEIASQKEETLMKEVSDNASVKSSIGSILAYFIF
ncbi:MAG: hypothetical protein IKE65_04540, partial [Clostridia bacterium]|nr:hypothetical protein [Clostridia bacterium]